MPAKLPPTKDLSLNGAELRQFKGFAAQKQLLERQFADVQAEEAEAVRELEDRLGIGHGALADGQYGIDFAARKVVPTPAEPAAETDV